MINKFVRLAQKINQCRSLLYWYIRIYASGLFDKDWYLARNPDVAQAKVNPLLHYMHHGGFEGRDPGPAFSSRGYLINYADATKAGINPLIHYLKFGRKEGRIAQPPYQCPVCNQLVNKFLPLPDYYIENLRNHGFPYQPHEGETVNFEQYACPHCSASDRDRLSASYLREKLPQYRGSDPALVLDIAPSLPLANLFKEFPLTRHTADLSAAGVDLVVDITNMPEVPASYYDILICSHVLEHVQDDKKALSELYRVLKPGGWAIIMVPIILTLDQIDEDPQVKDEAERWRRFGQFDHVRLYNKSGFVARLEAAGFSVRQLGVEYFGAANFKRYGITGSSVLYVAEKKAAPPRPRIKRECSFFFIIGTGRCGTTLMAQVLNAHSRICVPSELQIAFETSHNGARLAEIFASQEHLRFRAPDYIKLIDERCPHRLDAYYDYRTFFYELPYPILSLQWLLTELYTDIAYSQGKSMFAEQTPWYGKNIKLIHELFPEAKFIHMVRDGRDVAISFARTPWWHQDIQLNLERWAREVLEIEQDALHLVPQRMLTVRYEDLVSTPEKTTKLVCSFLDVPYEASMLEAERHVDYGQFSRPIGQEVSSTAYRKWQREKKSAFFSDNVYGWKTSQETRFDNLSETVSRSLQHFGYEV